MRYFLAVFFPPLALLVVNRPMQALLNLPLCLMCGLPGMIHAVLVVSQVIGDERQAELLTATTGVLHVPQSRADEWESIKILVFIALAFMGLAGIAGGFFWWQAASIAKQIPSPAVAKSVPATPPASPPKADPAIIGWDMDQVTAVYGEPVSKDKATALAAWETTDVKFTARFDHGHVVGLTEVVHKLHPP